MRRSLRFSTAPHTRRRLSWLLEPVILCSNLCVAAWIFPAWHTVRVHWHPTLTRFLQLIEQRSRPTILFGRHAYELLAFCAFRGFPPELKPTAIGHDGFTSRAFQQFSTWYGLPIWVYRRRSSVRPKMQLINLLAEGRGLFALFPDAGGPDGRLRQGLIDVARETRAALLPIAAHVRPAFRVPSRRKYWLPVPFSRINVFYGEPLDGGQCSVQSCQAALDALEAHKRPRSGSLTAGS